MTVIFNSTKFVDQARRIHPDVIGEQIIAFLPKLYIIQSSLISIRVITRPAHLLQMLTS